jgi:hypothetical protein
VGVLAWPICVCGAVLIALLIFKKEISRLIDRIRKISKQGVDADSLVAPQEVATVAKPSSADELLRSFDNQLLLEQENLITQFLDERKRSRRVRKGKDTGSIFGVSLYHQQV